MNKRLDNKGFTLVELIAVLVILIAIMGIAIPTISSSLERTKGKQNEARYKIIESAAEQYIADHKNAVYTKMGEEEKCYFKISDLASYLTDDDMKDASGNNIRDKFIIFTKPNSYEFEDDNTGIDSCINE